MKMTLIKVKTSKINRFKHESDTCKSKGAQKWQLEKLTEIEEQTKPIVRDCRWKCALSVDTCWKLHKNYFDRLMLCMFKLA